LDLFVVQGGCASAEAFLSVRRTFGSSFATLSMAAYICGIGDRHLGNWMYMNGTGELAAIDFGAAFGLGINMPVPELMPFRLTNQLRSFFAPLDTVALLKHDMIHALSALRRGRAAILPTFSVFVHEPIAEWAEAGMIYQSGGDDEFKTQWYPRQKVHFTKQKLLGFNPAAVMVEEMKATSYRLNGHAQFAKICEVVMGDKNSRRRQLPQNAPLSVSDQVDLLIEQSTDPNVLGRVFAGWSPFV
jgi:DNA-dependent protein kinase catalytic subunit